MVGSVSVNVNVADFCFVGLSGVESSAGTPGGDCVEGAPTSRITLLPVSATNMVPVGSTATPSGWFSRANVGSPPSPLYPCDRFPARTKTCVLVISKTVSVVSEALAYRLPNLSNASPPINSRTLPVEIPKSDHETKVSPRRAAEAYVTGSLSLSELPKNVLSPPPAAKESAIVSCPWRIVNDPSTGLTASTYPPLNSTGTDPMTTVSVSFSTATARTTPTVISVADDVWPELGSNVPPPAKIAIVSSLRPLTSPSALGATLKTSIAQGSAMSKDPLLLNASPSGHPIRALVAGPPIPSLPGTPLPTTVLIACETASSRRTREFCVSEKNRFPAVSKAT